MSDSSIDFAAGVACGAPERASAFDTALKLLMGEAEAEEAEIAVFVAVAVAGETELLVVALTTARQTQVLRYMVTCLCSIKNGNDNE